MTFLSFLRVDPIGPVVLEDTHLQLVFSEALQQMMLTGRRKGPAPDTRSDFVPPCARVKVAVGKKNHHKTYLT